MYMYIMPCWLYIYIVVFYGILTIVGYLMPNPPYTCLSNI